MQDHPWILFIAFPLLWFAACWFLAAVGGWHSLSRRYQLDRAFVGELWRFRSARFGHFASYSNMLTVGASSEGLYLAVIFIFRPWHPPLLVPWEAVRRGHRSGFSIFTTPLHVGENPSIRITVSSRLVEDMEETRGAVLAAV